jgi:membrane dipeptidase
MSDPGALRFADCHNDLLLGVMHQRERGQADPFGDFWLPQLRTGGVVLQVLPIYTEEQFIGEGALRRTIRIIETAYEAAESNKDDVAIVTTGTELRQAVESGRIALILAFEGMEPIGSDVDVIDAFFRLGVRLAGLTWNRRTMFADGVGERDTGGGLTSLGFEAVSRMEQVGMILDVSHLADAGFADVSRVATKPFVASHSSCRDVYEHPRNLTDKQLQTIAASGGFAAMNAVLYFCGDDGTVDEFLDHTQHAIEIIGADSVGFGFDYVTDIFEQVDPILRGLLVPEGGFRHIPGLERPSELVDFGPHLIERLGRETAAQVAATTMLEKFERLLPA